MKTTQSTRRVLLLSVLSTLTLGAGSAFAQVSATQVEKPVAHARDGQRHPGAEGPGKRDFPLTRQDALANASKRFDHVDANNDGTVTKDEMHAFRTERRDKMRKKLGAHSSGPDGQRPPHQGQREQPYVRPAP